MLSDKQRAGLLDSLDWDWDPALEKAREALETALTKLDASTVHNASLNIVECAKAAKSYITLVNEELAHAEEIASSVHGTLSDEFMGTTALSLGIDDLEDFEKEDYIAFYNSLCVEALSREVKRAIFVRDFDLARKLLSQR